MRLKFLLIWFILTKRESSICVAQLLYQLNIQSVELLLCLICHKLFPSLRDIAHSTEPRPLWHVYQTQPRRGCHQTLKCLFVLYSS